MLVVRETRPVSCLGDAPTPNSRADAPRSHQIEPREQRQPQFAAILPVISICMRTGAILSPLCQAWPLYASHQQPAGVSFRLSLSLRANLCCGNWKGFFFPNLGDKTTKCSYKGNIYSWRRSLPSKDRASGCFHRGLLLSKKALMKEAVHLNDSLLLGWISEAPTCGAGIHHLEPSWNNRLDEGQRLCCSLVGF